MMLHPYLIKIVMHDGSRDACRGSFASDWDAIDAMMGAFHDAARITLRREATR